MMDRMSVFSPTAAACSAAGWRLSLLYLLHLLRVPLRHLLRLLRVLLLGLLHSRGGSLLFRQLLMFLILRLLKFLPFLVLLGDHLILLFLVFLVHLRVPGVGSRNSGRRQFRRMDRRVGTRRCRHGRCAVVRGKLLLRIIVRRIRVLCLGGYWSGTLPASGSLFFR
jgi:hypothetical protein